MRIHKFFTPEKAAEALLHTLIKEIKSTPGNGMYHLAISGGESPLILFDCWAEHYKSHTLWDRLHLWWVDERCVPASDPESNYGEAKKHLLDKVPLSTTNIHYINGAADPGTEANRYGEEMRDYLLENNDVPFFNTVLLGLGTDGHTASIFPGHETLMESPLPCMATVNSAGQKRITVTGQPILKSERIVFFVTGEKKAAVMEQLAAFSDQLPASYLVGQRENIEFYLDRKAGGLL